MKRHILLFIIAALMIAGCGDDSDDQKGATEGEQAPAADPKDSVFGGYLVAIDKAKTAQQSANDRQSDMQGMFGDDRSIDSNPRLGLTGAKWDPNANKSEDSGVFDGMVNSLNKGKATRDMLNDRQQQMDALWGVEPQSTKGLPVSPTEETVEPESVAAEATEDRPESGMRSTIDRAREIREAANARNREFESVWGVESQSTPQ